MLDPVRAKFLHQLNQNRFQCIAPTPLAIGLVDLSALLCAGSGVARVAHCRVGRPLRLCQMLDPVRAKFLH